MKRYYPILIALVCLLGACQQESIKNIPTLTIEGQITGATKGYIFLEKMILGEISTIDSIEADQNGNFCFEVQNADASPIIYNIRYGKKLFPIIATANEQIRLTYKDTTSFDYTVEGSAEATAIQQIHSKLNEGTNSLRKLQREYKEESNEQQKQLLAKEYSDLYFAIKREHLGFVAINAGKIAGLYALYQRLPNEEFLSNGSNDIIYYRMVADSLSIVYPESGYLDALNKDIERMEKAAKLQNELADKMASPLGFPPIEVPNLQGKPISLSDVVAKNKATLVCFWLTTDANSTMYNAELRLLYEKYHSQGFEIYQIALDSSKSQWINTIQKQQLPWINLCDFNGVSSPACIAYNVTAVPSTFLIDNEGNIVGKNLSEEILTQKLNEILQ